MKTYYGKDKDPEERRKRARERYQKNAETIKPYARAMYHKHSHKVKEKYKKNPELFSNRRRCTAYKLSPEELQSLYETQRNRCAVCDKVCELYGYSGMCLDHDHETLQARGLVCRRCNIGLHYRENLEWAKKADAYLLRHQKEAH